MPVYNDRPPVALVMPAEAEAKSAESAPAKKGSAKIPQPEISIIVAGNKIFKPGMKSVFIEDDDTVTIGQETDIVNGGAYCSCNAVQFCSCNTVCTCESVGASAAGSSLGQCSCNQVCSCDPHCSCESHCGSYSSCTCQSRSSGGGSYCSCVPVH
ncbi:MAG: hypothetical protein FWC60_06565 [Firmicutes bacterium]|nr:hypothetical protein [Bacillota bacterium]